MFTFSLIVVIAPVWALSLFGVGRMFRRNDAASAAVLRGWLVFMMVCAVAWLVGLSASALAPAVWAMLGFGLVVAVRSLSRMAFAGALAGGMVVAMAFALPFALQRDLLAYAHWGTDQWGYAAVSKWLVLHSVNELPLLETKPGLSWVWHVLVTGERPLIYLELASLAGALGVPTVVVYFILPAAATIAVFLALVLDERALGEMGLGGRWLVGLAVALQPIGWLHFQHQFLAGAVVGAMALILVIALVGAQRSQPGDPVFFATAALFVALLAGLYTARVSLALLAMLGAVFVVSALQRSQRERLRREMTARSWAVSGALVMAAVAIFLWTQTVSPERIELFQGAETSRIWRQCGALFGLTDITPWYQRAGAQGALGIDPREYAPPGSALGVGLLGLAGGLLVVQGVRGWRESRDATLLLVLATVGLALALAVPPPGDNVVLSRTLPIFGALAIPLVALTAALRQARWSRWLALGLAVIPLARAVPGMVALLRQPANTLVAGQWDNPPNNDSWGAAAYVYFYQDTRMIDWTKAPEAFREMTHFLPPSLRPKLPEPK
jgi:hypothetical protein